MFCATINLLIGLLDIIPLCYISSWEIVFFFSLDCLIWPSDIYFSLWMPSTLIWACEIMTVLTCQRFIIGVCQFICSQLWQSLSKQRVLPSSHQTGDGPGGNGLQWHLSPSVEWTTVTSAQFPEKSCELHQPCGAQWWEIPVGALAKVEFLGGLEWGPEKMRHHGNWSMLGWK